MAAVGRYFPRSGRVRISWCVGCFSPFHVSVFLQAGETFLSNMYAMAPFLLQLRGNAFRMKDLCKSKFKQTKRNKTGQNKFSKHPALMWSKKPLLGVSWLVSCLIPYGVTEGNHSSSAFVK